MSNQSNPLLVGLPMPDKVVVGDMFGSVFHEELIIVLQVEKRDGKRYLTPQFGIEIEERDVLNGADGGYAYLGRMPEVFLGKMKEELGLDDDEDEDDGDDDEDDEEDEGLEDQDEVAE